MKEERNEEKNVLAAYYGSKAFVKIKQCLEIGKVQFSFVDKANSSQHIDCYMEAEEFGAILMAGIKNGTLINAIVVEKKKGEQYPKAVWQSPIGGNATGNNGRPVSRYFTISPASNGEVLFTGYAYPAEKNSTGAFIKVKDSQPLITLRVPCTYNDLRVLQYKWSFLEADYMGKKYTLENMKSTYVRQETGENTALQSITTQSASEPDVVDNAAEAPQTSSDAEDDGVPFVSSNTPTEASQMPSEPTGASEPMPLKLIAVSALKAVPNRDNTKVCKVTQDGVEKRLICITNKIMDNRFGDFEKQLADRVSQKQTLSFGAYVSAVGEDLYLLKFA